MVSLDRYLPDYQDISVGEGDSSGCRRHDPIGTAGTSGDLQACDPRALEQAWAAPELERSVLKYFWLNTASYGQELRPLNDAKQFNMLCHAPTLVS